MLKAFVGKQRFDIETAQRPPGRRTGRGGGGMGKGVASEELERDIRHSATVASL